ncbi:MAG: hypothetical protein ACOCV1_00825 [Bacillota bacterium]
MAIILILCIALGSFNACTLLNTNESTTEEVLIGIPSQTYLLEIRPLMEVIMLLYMDEMSQKELESYQIIIQELDNQAEIQEKVYILPALFLAARPILEEHADTANITDEQRAAALISLGLVKARLKDSPVVEAIYPTLLDILLKKYEE